MKRALLLITIVILLIIGGFISNSISQQGASALPGLKVQTDNPNASTMQVTPEKGAQFLIFAMIVLGSVVGMGVTIALVVWFTNRQLRQIEQTPDKKKASTG
ncbi:MAG: hypothetical protein ABI947_08775 [Chloroflexota bacterium]